MNFSLENLTKNDLLIDKLPLWSLITFFTVFQGFIGFYTYCGINNLPFIVPDIKLIIGIGLFNLFFISSLFIVHTSMWKDKAVKALMITGFFTFLLNNPNTIAVLSIVLILFYSRGYWEKQLGLSKLKSKEEEDPSLLENGSIIFEIFGLLAAIVIGYFHGGDFTWKYFVVYVLLFESKKILDEKSIRFVNLFIGVILIPMYITSTYLQDKSFNITGLYYSDVEIDFEDGSQKKGIMLFEDGNSIYFKDSIESKITHIISSSGIHEIKVLENSPEPIVEDSIKTNNVLEVIDSVENIRIKGDSTNMIKLE